MTRDKALERIAEVSKELLELPEKRRVELAVHDERSGRLAIVDRYNIRRKELLADLKMCLMDVEQMSLEEQEA